MKSVIIKANGYSLKGRIYGTLKKAEEHPALLFFSGWNPSSISWTTSDFYAWRCSKQFDIICLTAALRGMGSKGNINQVTRSDFLNDVIAVYDFIACHEGVDKARISIVGESFGAYLACLLSAKRPVENLILRVPTDFPGEGFSDIPQIHFVGIKSKEWKLQKHAPEESPALEAIHNFKNKIVIIASEKDAIVPQQTIDNYIASSSNPEEVKYYLMKNTGHALTNPLKLLKFNKILLDTICENLNES